MAPDPAAPDPGSRKLPPLAAPFPGSRKLLQHLPFSTPRCAFRCAFPRFTQAPATFTIFHPSQRFGAQLRLGCAFPRFTASTSCASAAPFPGSRKLLQRLPFSPLATFRKAAPFPAALRLSQVHASSAAPDPAAPAAAAPGCALPRLTQAPATFTIFHPSRLFAARADTPLHVTAQTSPTARDSSFGCAPTTDETSARTSVAGRVHHG